MKKKIVLIVSVIVIIIFGYLTYVEHNGGIELIPPEIVVKEDFYASSTNEMVIIWSIENIDYFPLNNTGIRYDTVSHATTTPTSETYAHVNLPAVINENGDFEIRIDFGDNEILYYRVQAKPVGIEGFLWSDEGSVKKIVLEEENITTE